MRRLPFATVVLLMLLQPYCDSTLGQADISIPRTLVVATRHVPPFSMRTETGEWVGISIELLRELKADLESQAEHEIALEFRELTLPETLDSVENGDVHLAAGALTVNYEREKRVDFTHAFHSSGLGIATAVEQRSGWWVVMSAVTSPGFLQLVAGLLAVLVATGLAIYFLERKKNPEHFGRGATNGIAAGLWWAAVTMTTVGYGDKVPKTAVGKLVGLIWMFSGLFIIASFTAAVTSALTLTRLESRISGPRDLSHVRVATVRDSTSDGYLRSRHIISRKVASVAAALATLESGEVDAVVYDAPILRHECTHHYDGRLQVLPLTFERQDYAFALPPQSPLRETINQVLLRKIGNPQWSDTLFDYLGEQ